MPFYKVPTTVDTSQESKRPVRALFRQSAAASPDTRKMALDTYTKMADAPVVNRINDTHYVGEPFDNNYSSFDGISPSRNVPSKPETIVEREIRLQTERELELSALRDTIYRAPTSPYNNEYQYEVNDHAPPLPKNPPPLGCSPLSVRPAPDGASTPPLESLISHASTSAQSLNHKSIFLSPEKSSLITYEEAISSRNHRGESLIAKEIREQQLREEELRKQWNNIKPGEENKSETCYRPTSSSSYSYLENNNNTPMDFVDSVKINSRVVENQPVISLNTTAAKHPPTSKVIVLPPNQYLETTEDLQFVPQDETPIEREMRLARIREDTLRAERGIPVSRYADSRGGDPPGVDVVIPLRRQPESDSTDHGKSDMTMKKLASNRLHMEIQKEKQRELEIRVKDRPRRPYGTTTAVEPNSNSNVGQDNSKLHYFLDSNYRHTNIHLDQFGRASNATTAESLIEKEMVEMQQREDELKKQRELLKPKFH